MKKSDNQKLEYKIMRLMAADSFSSSFALLIIVFAIASVFWEYTNQFLLFLWVFIIYAIIIARTLFIKSFLQDKLEMQLQKVESLFSVLTISSVIVLSIGIIFLFQKQDSLYQIFLIMVVAGTSAGAVMSLSYFKNLIRIYLGILIIPLGIVLYFQNSVVLQSLSYLVFLFFIMLVLFSAKYNKNILSTFRTKYQIFNTKKELEVSKNNFESIFNEVPIGIFTYNKELVITNSNKAFSKLLQAPMDKLISLDMNMLKDQSLSKDLKKVFHEEKGYYEGRYNTHISNISIWIKLNTVPMYDTNKNIVAGLGIVENITKQKEYQEKLKYQAYYDSLTSLLNRESLTQHIQQLTNKLQRSKEYGVLLFIDIDNFKNINDSLGHNVGDLILKIFATRVKNVLREEDIFARLGGDEFVILISQTNMNLTQINDTALNISEKIHNAIKEVIKIETNSLYITLSIGIKILKPKEKDVNTILKHADIAMYQSKNSGKNKTSFYDTAISQKMQEQLILHNELKVAIEKNQFELYLQPIVNLKTEKIVSAEALIRWNHPTKGVVYPDAFIGYAETSNLIIDIGNWVISRAFEIYKELSDSLEDIAINISLKQFYQDNFVNILIQNAQKYAVNPQHIKLELTESVTLKNLDETVKKMIILKEYGFKFSMDDFGTGYSSLSYLKNLPFDYLKIDQSFVLDMLESQNDKRLVKIIIDIAKQFDFLVIAEGVETLEHVNFMQNSGCDYYQGYFMSKPIPLNKFKEIL